MKMKNDVDISKCNFTADILPYIYGEISPAGISAFESHLLDCEECTDQLAAVSFARYEVYDWKKLEFDPLPTPRILPFEDKVEVVPARIFWFDSLRAAVGRGWLVPTSAFAAIAIVAVMFGLITYRSEEPIRDVVFDERPPASETVAPKSTDPISAPGPAVKRPLQTESKVARALPTKSVIRTRSVRTTKSTPVRNVPAVATKNAPRLNEFTDDEDTSLRLAQLFEDVDTRD